MPVLLEVCIFNLFLYFYQFVAFASRSLIFSWFLTCTSWRHGMKKYVRRNPGLLDTVFATRGLCKNWWKRFEWHSREVGWVYQKKRRAQLMDSGGGLCLAQGEQHLSASLKASSQGNSAKENHPLLGPLANLTGTGRSDKRQMSRVWHLLGTATALDGIALLKIRFFFL